MALENMKWNQSVTQQQMDMAERELAMQYQELLGSYGSGGNYGSSGDTYMDYYYPTQSTPTVQQSTGRGYDNGSLTSDQIKTLQAYYGLTQDGMWGPNSQNTTKMSADQAWAQYLLEKYEPQTAAQSNPLTQWFGKDIQQNTIPDYMLAETYYPYSSSTSSGAEIQQQMSNRGNLDYYPEEGIFVWNGKIYSNSEIMLNDMEMASLTSAEKRALEADFKMFGFDVKFDEETYNGNYTNEQRNGGSGTSWAGKR